MLPERPIILDPNWVCLHCAGRPRPPDRNGIIFCGACGRPIAALGDVLCNPGNRKKAS